MEVIHIHNRDSDSYYPESSSPTSETEHGLDPSLGKIGSDQDIEQTPTYTISTLSSSDSEIRQSERGPLLVSRCKWSLELLSPAISIAYLVFCYIAHYRVVPANISGLSADTTTGFRTNLGSVITTINIIIISLGLFPLRGLLCDLYAEEFFRLLSASKNSHGVDLDLVNGISNSSYSLVESIMVVVNLRCSLYYTMALVAAVFVWAVSTLAPAALSIQPILIDGGIMAFPVGAIPPLALYQPVPSGQVVLPSSFTPEPGYSAAIVWAEREIGLSYAFSVESDSQGAYAGFVVPTPPNLSSTTSARWLTDVIGINPYCTWANPVNLTAPSLNFALNDTNVPATAVSVHLEGADLQVSVPTSYFPGYDSFFVTSINVHDPTATVLNYTTGSLPTDGSMVMAVVQCTSTSCTAEAINIAALFVEVTNIPSMGFSFIGAEYELAFLVCKPNITIETREVRTLGSTTLQVQPLADGAAQLPRQGNLDWTQTSLLVSYSLSKLTTDSGPGSSAWNGLGSGTQADFLFGKSTMESIQTGVSSENTSLVLTALPTDQLAQGYVEMVKASMKPYVSGSLGISYVPGRIASVRQIFVSSLPHVIASTVLVTLLFAMAVVAHFRHGGGDQFNLTNVAAALVESEIPEVVKRVKVGAVMIEEEMERGGRFGRKRRLRRKVGQAVARKLGQWKVTLEAPSKADGLETLHIRRE